MPFVAQERVAKRGDASRCGWLLASYFGTESTPRFRIGCGMRNGQSHFALVAGDMWLCPRTSVRASTDLITSDRL